MAHVICLQTVSIVLVIFLDIGASEFCQRKTTCSCQLESGAFIDLSGLGNKNGKPHYTSKDVNGTEYEFNPCHEFTDRSASHVCDNVALCRKNTNKSKYTVLGRNANLQFGYDNTKGLVLLLYQVNVGKEDTISTRVYLQCSSKDELSSSSIKQVNKTLFEMVLLTKCACPDGCIYTISAGSILLIIFFSVTAAYFGVGMLYRKVVYRSGGWELLPHHMFWLDMPALVRDGYLFFISPCIGNQAQYQYYQRVPGRDFDVPNDHHENAEDEPSQ